MEWLKWYDPEKRIPGYVPPATDAATERAGTAFQLFLWAVVLIAASLVAFVFTAFAVALWLMLASIALSIIGGLIAPKEKRKPRL